MVVGDKVIMTSGIYALITRVTDKTVQLQIADKVREYPKTTIAAGAAVAAGVVAATLTSRSRDRSNSRSKSKSKSRKD